MKKVTCSLHFDDRRADRCEAFKKFCLLFMLLKVWDKTVIVDTKTGDMRVWYVDRDSKTKIRIGVYKP